MPDSAKRLTIILHHIDRVDQKYRALRLHHVDQHEGIELQGMGSPFALEAIISRDQK